MKQDQNRIELRLNTAEYDECVLYANGGTRVLPGSLLVFADGNVSNSGDPVRPNRGYASFDYEPKLSANVYSSTGVVDGYMMNPETGVIDRDTNWGPYTRYQFKVEKSESEADILEAYADAFEENETPSIELLKQKLAVPGSIERFPCAVVLENALFGKSLSHESPAGELVLCRYLTSSNEVLLRAVPGTYYYGDIVYAVQTKSNGIWVASEGTLSDGVAAGILDTGASLGMKVGICQEDYRITTAMCTIVDNTGPEDPTGYTSADRDVDASYAERYGASAIPEKLYGVDGFYQSNVSSSRYFAGAMLNLIKVRTTAFYASTTVFPAIEGVELPDSVTKRYNGKTWSLDTLLPVNVDGAEVSRDVVGGKEIRNRGDYTVVVTVSKEGFRSLTKRVSVTILPQPLVVNVTDGNPEWTRAADNTREPIKLDLTEYTTGIIDGEVITVYGTTDNLPGSAAGTYEDVQLFFTHTGNEKNNYYIVHEDPWPKVTVILTGSGPNPTGSEDPPEGLSVGYSSLGDTITYDGVDRPISDFFAFEGTEEGDDINYYVDGTLFGGEVPTVKLPGIYSVAITVDREGYGQFSETLPVTINKAHVTVTGSTAQGKVYDKNTYATLNLGTVTGFVAGDDATLGYSAAFASSLPGVQDVSVTYSLGGADIGNYILDTVNETLSAEITTRPFSITGTEIKEKVYDGTSAAEVVVGSVTGLIEGDDVTITGSALFHTVTVGEYNITVHYTLTGADADKYYAANQTRPTKIKPRRLTISGTTVADKTYDGTTDATITAGSLTNLVGSDTVELTASGSFPSAEVGVYDVEVSYSISGGASRNYYAPVNETISAEIIAASVPTLDNVELQVSSPSYNGGDQSVSQFVGAVIDGEEAGEGDTITCSPSTVKNAGTYSVEVTVEREGYQPYTETVELVVLKSQVSVSGTTVDNKIYDGTTEATVNLGTVNGLVVGEDVQVSASASFSNKVPGDYDVTVNYALTGSDVSNYALETSSATVQATISQKQLSVTGSSVSDKEYDGTTSATVTLGTVGGIVAGDTVNVAPTALFPSAEVGDYNLQVTYTLSGADSGNYYAPVNDTVSASIIDVGAPVYSYSAVANGGPTETTTEIAVNLIGDDPSAFPASVSYADIEIGGDAVLNTNAESCPVAMGVMIIPVRMLKSFKDSYEITIKITAGNQDKQVKPVPAYFIAGYWGIYPCQLGGDDEPSVDQITSMYGRNVLKGAKVSSVSCTFALNGLDWAHEVSKNGITGDDADINEAECGGYEFFLTCWDDTSITNIENEVGISQMAAFKSFTKTVNGVVYTGVISVNCELPTGTSPYTFSLS